MTSVTQANLPPVDEELDLRNLRITGELPRQLRGTLYRNGPNPVVPNAAMHWFFGNGMVHALRIADGCVHYRNRWMRTQAWASAAGCDASGLPEGVANTSVVSHAGALLALEEAHMPVRLHPETLATLGTEDFQGTLPKGTFTAHPKRCPLTGSLVFFGYAAEGFFSDAIRVGEISAAGERIWLEHIRTPYPGAMIHDFAVSENFIAIPLYPLVLDLAAGGFAFHPEHGSFLGVMDRTAGPASLRWHPVAPGFAFHVAQAWDRDGVLTIELMRSEAPPLFPGSTASTTAFLTRYELEPAAAAGGVRESRLTEMEGELPRIDERCAGSRARNVFWTTGEAICRRDDRDGGLASFAVSPGDTVSEAVFVPRSAGEGDGWLLAMIYRAADHRSDLAVLDANDLAAGPVALAHLPCRVPDGFHGAWLTASG